MVKNRIYITSRKGNKWAVVIPLKKRALKVFKHREQAYNYACNLFPGEYKRIYVMNNNPTKLAFYDDIDTPKTLTITGKITTIKKKNFNC